jgi:hypothetical protein
VSATLTSTGRRRLTLSLFAATVSRPLVVLRGRSPLRIEGAMLSGTARFVLTGPAGTRFRLKVEYAGVGG